MANKQRFFISIISDVLQVLFPASVTLVEGNSNIHFENGIIE